MWRFLSFILSLCLLAVNANSQSAGNWYKTFSGKTGNRTIVLHLVYSGSYIGYLWFRDNQQPVQVWVEKNGDSLNLTSVGGPLLFYIRGRLDQDSFEGNISTGIPGSDSTTEAVALTLKADPVYTPLKIISVHAGAHLSPKLKNASTFSYDKFTVWPIRKSNLSSGIENAVRSFWRIPNNVEVNYWLIKDSEKQRIAWLQENNKLTPAQLADMGLSLSEATQEQIMVMYENEKTITLADFNYAYTGGAHGNYATSLKNIYKKTGNLLSLTDVLTENGITRLPKLLEKVAREQFGAQEGTLEDNGFFVERIPVSKEFYITHKGIGFLYPPYELRSFAEGEINLFVPFYDLLADLKSDFNP